MKRRCTIGGDPTRASDRAPRSHPRNRSANGLIGISFQLAAESSRLRYWAGCITSTDSNERHRCLHGCRTQYLRKTGIRQQPGCERHHDQEHPRLIQHLRE